MNTDNQSVPPMNQLPETAKEMARRAAEVAKETAQKTTAIGEDVAGYVKGVAGDVTEATKETAKYATDTAKDIYQSAAIKAEETLATSKEYVRRNPVPVVLGAVAFGAALGYILFTARRKPTFSERYADESLAAVREAILSGFSPVKQGLHKGYDSARDGAEKIINRVQNFRPDHASDSFSDQIGRIGNNLKFW